MANFQARVFVSLRPSVLDPAGEAVKSAANRLGVDGIKKLRIGKLINLSIEAPDEKDARQRIEMLAERLLSNPVIEDWSLEIETAQSSN